jgi:histidine triad (HIT) family protein
MDCLFCKIGKGEIPADIIYRDDSVIAFADINPHAPHHLLIVPHKHIATLNDLTDEDDALIGKMAHAAKVLAKRLNVQDEGYRLVMNCNKGAGQTVFHIHMHFLGGRDLNWPPG